MSAVTVLVHVDSDRDSAKWIFYSCGPAFSAGKLVLLPD